MSISELGELHFDMMSPNFRHFGGANKSHKEERRTQARQCLETFDFGPYGTFLGHDKWRWQDSTSSVVSGMVTVRLRNLQGAECERMFRVTWVNNKPMGKLTGVDNA